MEGGGTKGTGLAPNIASFICYLCPPITSIVMMLLERESKDVQFHAWQATILGVTGFIFWIGGLILGFIPFIGILMAFVMPLFGLGYFILVIVLMIKAYQGEHYKLPYLGDFAEKQLMK